MNRDSLHRSARSTLARLARARMDNDAFRWEAAEVLRHVIGFSGHREMTFTETEFEKASLRELDFDPPCDCRLTIFNLFGRVLVVRQCDKPARWAANMPCCSHQTLSCPEHRYSTIFDQCSRCKQWVPALKLRWRRI